jgi:hypothetical protein
VGALVFFWFAVLPVWRVCAAVDRCAASNPKYFARSSAAEVEELGGREEAARLLTLYFRLPDSLSRNKVVATQMLESCGGAGVPTLIRLTKHDDAEVRCYSSSICVRVNTT